MIFLYGAIKMNGRERITRAIEFKGPNKVPQPMRDLFPLFFVPPGSWQPRQPYYPYVHPLIIKGKLGASTPAKFMAPFCNFTVRPKKKLFEMTRRYKRVILGTPVVNQHYPVRSCFFILFRNRYMDIR